MASILLNPAVYEHPSILVLPPSGAFAWTASICWLSRHGRAPGFPSEIAPQFRAGSRVRKALLSEGLWVQEGAITTVPQWVESNWCARMRLWKYGPSLRSGGVRPKIPDALRHSVYKRDGYACLHCGATKKLTLDHIHPFSLGGEDTYENFQTLCGSCNSRKGARV